MMAAHFRPGGVVQLDAPDHPEWHGCFLVVDQVDERLGYVEGWIPVPARGDAPAHSVFLRAPFAEVLPVGDQRIALPARVC